MRILIAPDSFKGTLTAVEAAGAMADGIKRALPQAELIRMPLADAGEGTLQILQAEFGGRVEQGVLCFDDHGTAGCLIESARFIGLHHPSLSADPFARGSGALGDVLVTALDRGAEHIYIALGGSGTVDGGLGLLNALGCRAKDGDGRSVTPDLNGLLQVATLDPNGLDARLNGVALTLLVDVLAPVTGPDGAVQCYGAQKGIGVHRMGDVELAMRRWVAICESAFGAPDRYRYRGGAAGGLAFALQLLGAQMVSGAEFVMNACGFSEQVCRAHWLVTGEGRSDVQTLQGKLPLVVARGARAAGAKTALISGSIEIPEQLLGFFDAIEVCGKLVPLSREQAWVNLERAAFRWARSLPES